MGKEDSVSKVGVHDDFESAFNTGGTNDPPALEVLLSETRHGAFERLARTNTTKDKIKRIENSINSNTYSLILIGTF